MTESAPLNVDQARQQYVDEVRLDGGATNPLVRRALATVARERFYGPGPWRFATRDPMAALSPTYVTTEDDQPARIYRNASIPLDETRQLLSGHPGLVARYLDLLDIRPGQHVIHLGSGTGYYTALLAELVGPGGRVDATEADEALARQAQVNLAHCRQVTVQHTTEATGVHASAHAILMSFGVTHLESAWLDRLCDGGCLLVSLTVPLNPSQGMGVLFKITRAGGEFNAQFVQPTAGFSGVGVRDPAMAQALAQALQSGSILQVTRVRREPHPIGHTCVLHREGACLSKADAPLPVQALLVRSTLKF